MKTTVKNQKYETFGKVYEETDESLIANIFVEKIL